MQNRKSLIKKLDDLTRKMVFFRDKDTCVRCGRTRPYQLHWSHVVTRENKALRWDVSNSKTLCYLCHKWFHDNPTYSGEWFKEKYPGRHEHITKHLNDIQKTDVYHLQEKYEALKQLAEQLGVI